jgi:hypothetical protein
LPAEAIVEDFNNGDPQMEEKTLREPLVILDGPNQFVGYANVTAILLSTDDVILHFGQRNPKKVKEGVGIAKIYLGLPHAKRLAIALNQTIQKYESGFGEIVSDPGSRLSAEEKARFETE